MEAEDKVRPLRLGVLVSGRGTNLQAILDAIGSGRLDAQVSLVICNHWGAQALERARNAGVPVEIYVMNDYSSRLDWQRAITARLIEEKVDLVVCAGWDKIFAPEFFDTFGGRVINVHPSLLPAFAGGLQAVEDALEYGVKVTGCTVHFVNDDLDAGPIILQAAVPVLTGDTAETLAERIHKEEHRLLVEAINLFKAGRLRVAGRKVEVT
jgi:phosphoribosylglycinamide formyltransferase-1